MRTIEFTKMEGLGNDYIYVDVSRFPIDDPSGLALRLSDRHFGIGADGLVLIGPSEKADFSMRMFNADGSEGLMCGNAARCIGKYVFDKGLTHKTVFTLETLSGQKRLHVHTGADGLVESVTVGMGGYSISEPELRVQAGGRSFSGTVVNVGNPHFVIFCDDARAVDLETWGPLIENHPAFPGRINVEFVSAVSKHPDARAKSLRMRVWERGSGITLACGTGACATAAAAVKKGIAGSHVEIIMDGGSLQIATDRESGSIVMRGPARRVFEGSLEL